MEEVDGEANYNNDGSKTYDIFTRILIHFGNLQTLPRSSIGYI
jgi:hypothetical protein